MANDHAMLQSIMHLKTRHQIHGKIPKPCCVGRKFRPLDILHVDDLDPTKLKVTRWKDVIETFVDTHTTRSRREWVDLVDLITGYGTAK